MKWAIESKKNNVLFAGDGNVIKPYLKDYFPNITTSSISNDSDFYWNFEKELPKGIGTFDLIISQACFEHIINPYKHLEDMASLLNKGGRLIVHTNTQFHCYHRYPIDTLRYNPDWFEEVAKRINLEVVKRRVSKTYITYMFQKK
jgi:SAM-dependent methyltransferase